MNEHQSPLVVCENAHSCDMVAKSPGSGVRTEVLGMLFVQGHLSGPRFLVCRMIPLEERCDLMRRLQENAQHVARPMMCVRGISCSPPDCFLILCILHFGR